MVIFDKKPHQTVTFGECKGISLNAFDKFLISNSEVLNIYSSIQIKVGLISHKTFQGQTSLTFILARKNKIQSLIMVDVTQLLYTADLVWIEVDNLS